MKLALFVSFQVALVFALAASCSITHRTGDFACTTTADCNSGRECSDGFCVVTGTAIDAPPGVHIDAPKAPGDTGNGCPPGCTSCDVTAKSCTIDCANGGMCNSEVVCPVGWSCDVKCDVDNACRSGVTCTGTTSCKVECTGKGSCEDVQCGTGRCDVECTGLQSCKSQIECNNSCGCDVRCQGQQSCPEGAVTCSGATICSIGNGCTSLPSVCHSCP